MLTLTQLQTYYGDSHVLRGVDLDLVAGCALGLLGRNGMGKTTLIRTLMGCLRPTEGRVQWTGHDGHGRDGLKGNPRQTPSSFANPLWSALNDRESPASVADAQPRRRPARRVLSADRSGCCYRP